MNNNKYLSTKRTLSSKGFRTFSNAKDYQNLSIHVNGRGRGSSSFRNLIFQDILNIKRITERHEFSLQLHQITLKHAFAMNDSNNEY